MLDYAAFEDRDKRNIEECEYSFLVDCITFHQIFTTPMPCGERVYFSPHRCWAWQCKLLWPMVCKREQHTPQLSKLFKTFAYFDMVSWTSSLYHKKNIVQVSLLQHPEFWNEKTRGSEPNSTHVWTTTANLQVCDWEINDGNCKLLKLGL